MAIGGFPDRLSGRVDGEERAWVALPGSHAVRGEVTAIYGTSPSASPQVPTGLVSIRFAEDMRAEDQRDPLAAAGYEIVRVPGYAPHAAWVKAASGSIRDSLEGLERLLALPGVQAVEPELLGERASR
jgi:hypothetical protein